MNRSLKILLAVVVLICAGHRGSSQSVNPGMAPVIRKMQDSVVKTEKDGDVVDDVLYDYIFREQSSVSDYYYQLFVKQDYTFMVIPDDGGNTNYMIRIYRKLGNDWTLQIQSASGGTTPVVRFTPSGTEPERYKISVSCDLNSAKQASCFGLLIVRAE
jgi:hypothetical protein